MRNPFRYFNSSPEVIRLVVMMYIRSRLVRPLGRPGRGPGGDLGGPYRLCRRAHPGRRFRLLRRALPQPQGAAGRDPDEQSEQHAIERIEAIVGQRVQHRGGMVDLVELPEQRRQGRFRPSPLPRHLQDAHPRASLRDRSLTKNSKIPSSNFQRDVQNRKSVTATRISAFGGKAEVDFGRLEVCL